MSGDFAMPDPSPPTLAGQIHEDGHSIGQITGGTPEGMWKKGSGDGTTLGAEFGRVYQDCIYAEYLRPGNYNGDPVLLQVTPSSSP